MAIRRQKIEDARSEGNRRILRWQCADGRCGLKISRVRASLIIEQLSYHKLEMIHSN